MNRKIIATNFTAIKLNQNQFTAYFCQNLLEYPEIKHLLTHNQLKLEMLKLMSILSLIVRNLDNKNDLKKLFNFLLSKFLTVEIIAYGSIFRDAFFKALESYLGDLQPEIEAAWTEVYNLILNLVLEDRSKNSYFNWESQEFIDSLNRIRLEITARATLRSICQKARICRANQGSPTDSLGKRFTKINSKKNGKD